MPSRPRKASKTRSKSKSKSKSKAEILAKIVSRQPDAKTRSKSKSKSKATSKTKLRIKSNVKPKVNHITKSNTKRVIKGGTNYWSKEVTEHSNAMDLEPGVFTWDDPYDIAVSLKRTVEESPRLKSTPYKAAISMLTFYINRAGHNLSPERIKILNDAKKELRKLFGRT